MPPIEVGATDAVNAILTRLARTAGGTDTNGNATGKAAGKTADKAADAKPSVETSEVLSAGSEPVDTDRVAQIRKAVETGNYPLIPTQVADAMIAAGALLRSPQ